MKCMTSYILALVLAAGTWTAASAQDEGATQDDGGVFVDGNGDGIEDGFRKGRRGGRRGHRGRPALGSPERGPRLNRGRLNLDPEVKAQIEQLKADGATREEVRTALAAQGVELPERSRRGHRPRRPGRAPLP